jgi:hypothetical protein
MGVFEKETKVKLNATLMEVKIIAWKFHVELTIWGMIEKPLEISIVYPL